LNQSYGARSPFADRTNSPAPENDVKKPVGEASKAQRQRPPSPLVSVVGRSRSDEPPPGVATPPPQSENYGAKRDGRQSPERTGSPTTQSPEEVGTPRSRSPCSLSPRGPRVKSPSERGVLDVQETQTEDGQGVYHTCDGVVRSAMRQIPSDFGRRRARRRESSGTEAPARRVTFAEEEPKLKSPPRWYLDYFECTSGLDTRGSVPNRMDHQPPRCAGSFEKATNATVSSSLLRWR